MSDESLSQNQVESLLKAMEDAPPSEAAPGAPPSPADMAAADRRGSDGSGKSSAADPAKPSARVTAYDFKRPERVSKEQMRSIQTLHESLARGFGAAFSGLLRTMIEVNLVSVDQLTYSEFIFGLDNPSCFSVLSIAPLEGNWVLDIAPALSYAIIDRMLGGDPNPDEAVRRPLTDIENRLIGRVVRLFLDQLTETWENIVA